MATSQDLVNADLNLATLDGVVTSNAASVNDRLGQPKLTLKGFESRVDAAIAASGFYPASGSFEAGGTITERNQVLQRTTPPAAYFSWGGALPKVVPPSSTVAGTGGEGVTAWTNRNDATLTGALADGSADIAGQTAQSVADLRGDLADGTADVGGVQSSRLAKTVIQVSHLKALPTTGLIDGQQFSVAGFYAGSNLGGGTFVYDASRSWADHNGGTVIAPPAIAAWDGTQANIAILLNWTGSGSGCYVRVITDVIKPEFFGAISKEENGGVLINNSAPFQSCVKAMNTTRVPMMVDGTFHANSVLSTGYTVIDGAGTIFQDNVSIYGFNIELSTSNVGSYSSLSDVAMPSPNGIVVTKLNGVISVSIGDVVQVVDNSILSGTTNVRFAETATVLAVDGTGVWLDCVLRHRSYYSGGSVFKLSKEVVSIKGLEFKATDSAFSGSAVRSTSLTVSGAVSPVIDIKVDNDIGSGLALRGCYKPLANVVANNLRDREDLNSYGYGVVCYGCCKGAEVNVLATQVRHAYTDGIWNDSNFKSFNHGFTLDSTVRGKAFATSAASWDTHPYSDNCNFIDTESYEGKSNSSGNKDNAYAYQLRGTNARIVNGRTDRDKALFYAVGLFALIDSSDFAQITELKKTAANNTVSHTENISGKSVKLTVSDSYLIGIPFSSATANITPVKFQNTTIDNKGGNYDQGTVKVYDYEFVNCVLMDFNIFRMRKGKYVFQGGKRLTTSAATGVTPMTIYDGVTVAAINFGGEAQSFGFSSLFLADTAATSATTFFHSGCFLYQRNGSTTRNVIFTQGAPITIVDVTATAVRVS